MQYWRAYATYSTYVGGQELIKSYFPIQVWIVQVDEYDGDAYAWWLETLVPCTSPLSAWQLEGGGVSFVERGSILRSLTLPCGQCMDCRLERSRQWAVRCMHESQMWDYNSFITLTYSDDHLPGDGSLVYADYQRFMKRLRKKLNHPVRFYMCGEYGETTFRPHYHACLFNCFFSDRNFLFQSDSGSNVYRSALLESLWPFGHCSVGDVTFESAAYVARYITKKITGPAAAAHYTRVDADTGEVFHVEPEFSRMSLKPGIGATWFAKFRSDVFPLDRVVVRGVEMKPPKYYDKLLVAAPDMMSDEVEFTRGELARKLAPLQTDQLLEAHAARTKARLNLKPRSIK